MTYNYNYKIIQVDTINTITIQIDNWKEDPKMKYAHSTNRTFYKPCASLS